MNLLSAVRKYPVCGNDPLENFITEAWAWTLSHYPNFSTDFLNWFFNVNDPEVEWRTQLFYNGYVDLIGISDTNIFIFEHKVDAPFQQDQLERYLSEANKRHKTLNHYVAVIGRVNRKSQISLNECYVKTWADVALWVNHYISKLGEENIEEKFVLGNIINLLKKEGLGPMEPIKEETLKNYYLVYGLEDQIKGIFRKLRDEIDWKEVMKDIPRSDNEEKKFIPRSIKNNYGRIGIEFSRYYDWNPSCFFGVLLDPTDHGLDAPVTGPDLCFIIDFNKPHHSQYETYPEYESLKAEMKLLEQKMKLSDKKWYFYDHLKDKNATRKNRWHPLYMRWSFAEFLKDIKPEKQTEVIGDELLSFMKTFLKECPSFLRLRMKLI